MWGLTGESGSWQVYCTPDAITTIRTRVAEFARLSSKQTERCAKALRYGYHMDRASMQMVELHHEELTANCEAICKDIDVDQHRSNVCEQQAVWSAKYATIKVASSTEEAAGYFEFSNINRAYAGQGYLDFNVSSLGDLAAPGHGGQWPIKAQTGVTTKLTVNACMIVTTSRRQITVCSIEGAWATFIKSIEKIGNVRFPDFNRDGIDGQDDTVFHFSNDVKVFSKNGDKVNQDRLVTGVICELSFTMRISRRREIELVVTCIRLRNVAPARETPKESLSSSSDDDKRPSSPRRVSSLVAEVTKRKMVSPNESSDEF